MNLNVELPTDATERRRLQNRIAQRKFRQKRDQRRIADEAHNDTPSSSATQSPNLPLPPSSQSSNIRTPEVCFSAAGSTNKPDFSSLDLSDASYSTGPSADDINFDLDAIDSLSPNANTSGSSFEPSFSRPRFTQDLDFASSNTAQTSSTVPRLRDPFFSSSELSAPDSGGAQNQSLHRHTDFISSRHNDISNSIFTPAKDDGWLSTLHIAAQKGNDRIVRTLMQCSIDCNEKDSDGRTPLMYAVVGNHEAVVSTLLAHGARLSEVDREHRNALHWAVLYRRENVLRVLLERYSERVQELDIDAYDHAEWTPLHMAVERGFESGVLMLLQCGANLNFKARKCPYTGKMIPHQET
ncbi:MAG: hypothetical protein M1822_001339 [Bathelium mastoideum]|nr:MAG: hypothetical protein M1822_001339 [Bathelium mastoideum]